MAAKRKSKTKTRTSKASKNGAAGDATVNRLEQVRELLFGNDRQATDHRFRQMEEVFSRELERHEKQTQKAIAQVEQQLRREVDGVTKLIEGERRQRSEEEEAAAKRLEATKNTLQGKLQRVDDENKQRCRTLRSRLSSTTTKLREEFAEADTRVWNGLQEQLLQLGASSTDRQVLSSLFEELSKSLVAE